MGDQLRSSRVSVIDIDQLLSIHQTLFPDWDHTSQYANRNYRYSVEQSVTLAVVASKSRIWIRFASVNLSVAELRTRLKPHSCGKYPVSLSPVSSADCWLNDDPAGYHEFIIVDSSSSIQLLMTCHVKASASFIMDNPPSSVVADGSTWLN